MSNTTAKGFPYVEPADPIADYPVLSKALADLLDARVAGAELGFAQLTAGLSISGTVEAAAILVLALPAIVFDGATLIVVEFDCGGIYTSGHANQGVFLSLWDAKDGAAAVDLGVWVQISSGAAANQVGVPVHRLRRLTPAAGSHVYSVRAHCAVAGSSALNAGPGTAPGQFSPTILRALRA